MDASTALSAVQQLLATADTFLRESQRLFRPQGLSAAQFNVLTALSDHPAGLSQRALSDLLVVDRSNVTGLLDRMGEAGWVRRQDDPADRRAYRVVLTAAGRRLWEKVQPEYHAAAVAVVGRLGAARVKPLIETLRELEASATAWGAKLASSEKPAPRRKATAGPRRATH